jgi:hypothetical protein
VYLVFRHTRNFIKERKQIPEILILKRSDYGISPKGVGLICHIPRDRHHPQMAEDMICFNYKI